MIHGPHQTIKDHVLIFEFMQSLYSVELVDFKLRVILDSFSGLSHSTSLTVDDHKHLFYFVSQTSYALCTLPNTKYFKRLKSY